MGRKKIKMSLIADNRVRRTTFKTRKLGLLKKARELSVLCDVPACVIISDPDRPSHTETWPENLEEVQYIIAKYRAQADEKSVTVTNAGKNHCTSLDDKLDRMSVDQLRELFGTLHDKLERLNSRIDFLQIVDGLSSENVGYYGSGLSKNQGYDGTGLSENVGYGDGIFGQTLQPDLDALFDLGSEFSCQALHMMSQNMGYDGTELLENVGYHGNGMFEQTLQSDVDALFGLGSEFSSQTQNSYATDFVQPCRSLTQQGPWMIMVQGDEQGCGTSNCYEVEPCWSQYSSGLYSDCGSVTRGSIDDVAGRRWSWN